MAFPTAPTNGQITTVNGIRYSYNSVQNAWIRISNGKFTAAATGPSNPATGDHWYNTGEDTLYEYVSDGVSSYWIDIQTGFVGGSSTGLLSNTTIAGTLTMTGNIIPSANVTYDLGSSTQRFKDLFLSGSTIDLGGATIKTDAASGAIALIPQPTVANPNPTGIVVSPSGTVSTVSTTGGTLTTNAISNSSNTAVTTNTTTFGNITANGNVVTANVYADRFFYSNGTAFSSSSFGNTEVAAYLAGNIQNNVTVTGNVTGTTFRLLNGATIKDTSGDAVAFGQLAGNSAQGTGAVAIGDRAGSTSQGIQAVAIGQQAGAGTQGSYSVAVGYLAGTGTGTHAVSIGVNAGGGSGANHGNYSVAIGAYAGYGLSGNNSIIINATGSQINSNQVGACIVAPIRNQVTQVSQVLVYANQEITYANTLNLAGNIQAGNIITTGNVTGTTFRFANGVNILSTVTGTYGNTEVAAYFTSNNSGLSSTTGAITIPIGTTGERPTTTSNGALRYNTTLGRIEAYMYASGWVSIVSDNYSIDYLVVAGGGGGGGQGSNGGGGGGAGGYLSGNSVTVTAGSTYPVVVGGGGAVGTTGSNGVDSSFYSQTSVGGGGGGTSGGAGNSGGSGGGRGRDGGTTAQTNGTAGQGNAGGAAGGVSCSSGGGGGGAGQAGYQGGTDCGAPRSGTLAKGGDGLQWLNGTYYAGGGGGAWEGISTNLAPGGAGGGGAGGSAYNSPAINAHAGAGTTNTGGGGGGGQTYPPGSNVGNAGAGGSGVVIIRYLGSQRGTGGTITSAEGYTYHTFTGSGSFIP